MSTSIEQEITKSNEHNLSVGLQLKRARTSKDLTIQNVNEIIRVNTRILQAFENDQFEIDDFDLVYLRAYLKKYAEFLELDPQKLVNQAFPPKTNTNSRKTEIAHAKASSTSAQSDAYVRERNPNFIRKIYFIILTLAILSLVVFIIYKTLNDNKGVNTINSPTEISKVNNTTNSEVNAVDPNTNNTVITDNNLNNSDNGSTNNSSNSNSTTDVNNNTNANNNLDNTTNDSNLNTTDTSNQNQTDSSTNVTNNTSSTTKVDSDKASKSEKDYSNLPAQGKFNPNDLNIPTTGLYILMNDDTWNRVINNTKGKTTYAKVFNKGTYLYINTPGSYSVRIGKPYKVEVYFNGKKLELKPNSKRVANFNVEIQ